VSSFDIILKRRDIALMDPRAVFSPRVPFWHHRGPISSHAQLPTDPP